MSGWRVPGRLEVLGKHTDYGGGRVLVCAVERGVTVVGEPGGDGIHARSAAFPDQDIVLRAGTPPKLPAGHWGHYVQTVIDRLTLNFGPVATCRLEISSDLPPASGMSSSSALLSGVALTLADLNGFAETELWQRHCPDRLALAGYLAAIENGGRVGDLVGAAGVGTSGGSLDHTGMLASEPGMISYVRFDPAEVLGRVALDEEWAFVVAVSGVLAEKTGAAMELYNRGPATLKGWLEKWNQLSGRRDSSVQAALAHAGRDELLEAATPGYERRRLEQFVVESGELVPAAYRALGEGDLAEFGRIVAESQRLAVEGLDNQVPETQALVRLALEGGAVASSAFGAGFGGSVWALTKRSDADGFARSWLDGYRARFDLPGATSLVTRPAGPGQRLV